jgi:hypothetical protein
MNKKQALQIGVAGTLLIAGIIILAGSITCSNREKSLRNAITAKQADNRNQMDALWKSIAQVAQVAEKDRQSLQDIFVNYAGARGGTNGNSAVMRWIQESAPNVDTKTFQNLQNTIVAERDSFKFRQQELLDLNREHDNCIDLWPSSMFVGGRSKINVTIVTSTKVEDSFKTGKDDDVDVFKK